MLSPQVGELLLQVTQSQDLDEALQKVLRDYIEIKVATLSAEIRHFEERWGCVIKGKGLGRRFLTRGPTRPGRHGLRSRSRSCTSPLYPTSPAGDGGCSPARAHQSRKRTTVD